MVACAVVDQFAKPERFGTIRYDIFILIAKEYDSIRTPGHAARQFSLPGHIRTEITLTYCANPAWNAGFG